MGLFDAIAGQVTGALAGNVGAGGLMEVAMGLLNNPQLGGLQGLVAAFEKQGLGSIISSWIGNGANLPISAEQLQAVLGNAQVQAMAQKVGLSPQDLAGQLAGMLPGLVDSLTPGGKLPEGGIAGGALGSALGMLKGFGG
jgi:uncharacterized protein YidB (DUF937 family)